MLRNGNKEVSVFKYFSFPFDVDLLIDLNSQAQPLNFFLSSAEHSQTENITVMCCSGLPPSRLLERVTDCFVFFPRLPTDKTYTGSSVYDASLAEQLLSWVHQGI
jgi:hypothetical protein